MEKTFAARRGSGRIEVTLQGIRLGDDLMLALYGGVRPHIGAVAVSQPRPSLTPGNPPSATTSVIALLGHKEDQLARNMADKVASAAGVVVTVACGIHVEEITVEEIDEVGSLVDLLTEELILWAKPRN